MNSTGNIWMNFRIDNLMELIQIAQMRNMAGNVWNYDVEMMGMNTSIKHESNQCTRIRLNVPIYSWVIMFETWPKLLHFHIWSHPDYAILPPYSPTLSNLDAGVYIYTHTSLSIYIYTRWPPFLYISHYPLLCKCICI